MSVYRILPFVCVLLFTVTGCRLTHTENKQLSSTVSNAESIDKLNEKQLNNSLFLKLLITQFCAFALLGWQNYANKKNSDRQFFLQKRNSDVVSYAPVLLDILKDLNILHSTLVYKGAFCPIIEHRCPNITWQDPIPATDGTHSHSMSVAQRGHQFFLIGLRLVDNCKKIIFLAKKKELPKTIALCREIKQFLWSLEQGKKYKVTKDDDEYPELRKRCHSRQR